MPAALPVNSSILSCNPSAWSFCAVDIDLVPDVTGLYRHEDYGQLEDIDNIRNSIISRLVS
jgi:hypothetical protein